MRITNKIMQNNSLSNINTNKVLQDKLNTQMASGKKINRPSDDPVIAIRALRLRTTLTEVTQYCDKNVEDADSWLKVTEDAINTVITILEDMYEQCNSGSNKDLTTTNRQIILENVEALRDELYATGDADYAGRGLFTGYRTSTNLRFEEDTQQTYKITEEVDKAALDDITYVKMDNGKTSIGEINSGNYTNTDYAAADTDVYQETVHRLRLSYDALDAGMTPTITYYNGDARMAVTDPTASGYNSSTNTYKTVKVDTISLYATDTDPASSTYGQLIDPYLAANKHTPASDDYAVFIPETGELILNDTAYNHLSATRDYAASGDVDESLISVTYQKTSWDKGDLRPEHYFKCIEDPAEKNIEHNYDADADDQVISYDVGFNQEIRVNTLASECYTHAIGRDVDDLVNLIGQVNDVEASIAELEDVIEDTATSTTDKATAEKSLAAAEKALTFLNQKLQTSFENAITKMQKHMDKATLALTDVGTRSRKLALVQTRLASQKTNFKDLVADNEQADTAEVATDLASAKLAYDAALMATGKLTDSTLMNYI